MLDGPYLLTEAGTIIALPLPCSGLFLKGNNTCSVSQCIAVYGNACYHNPGTGKRGMSAGVIPSSNKGGR